MVVVGVDVDVVLQIVVDGSGGDEQVSALVVFAEYMVRLWW